MWKNAFSNAVPFIVPVAVGGNAHVTVVGGMLGVPRNPVSLFGSAT